MSQPGAGTRRGEIDVPDGSADVVLPTELRPGEVVRDPADARDDHEHEQLLPIPRRLVPQAQKQREHRHREERCSIKNQTKPDILASCRAETPQGQAKNTHSTRARGCSDTIGRSSGSARNYSPPARRSIFSLFSGILRRQWRGRIRGRANIHRRNTVGLRRRRGCGTIARDCRRAR